MTQQIKTNVFIASTALIILNVFLAYIWRQYPAAIWGIVSLAALVVSFVFAILALCHRFTKQQGKGQIIRGVLLVFVIAVYPLFYAILGFMSIGMSHS